MTTRRFTRKVAACLPVATVVVCIVIFAWFTFLRCGPTYYSEGYSEGKFLRLREGMTTREVEAIIGRPLEQVSQADGRVLWTFSNRENYTCSFEMRWVYFKGGVVSAIANIHWED